MGYNPYSKLGVDTGGYDVYAPTQIGSATSWAQVSGCSDPHTCALTTTGTRFCWGENLSGQLGLGDNTSRTQPTRAGKADGQWIVVSAGYEHTCGIKATDNSLHCWGHNLYGRLGVGDTTTRLSPTALA